MIVSSSEWSRAWLGSLRPLILDTPLKTAYLGPANENVLVVDRLASITT